jgi:hypothetical protein
VRTTTKLVIFIFNLVQARVLQIKEEEIEKGKFFYVHFLNLEKRMDRWVSGGQINIEQSGGGVVVSIVFLYLDISVIFWA